MNFIRPEARETIWRWREVLVGAAAIDVDDSGTTDAATVTAGATTLGTDAAGATAATTHS